MPTRSLPYTLEAVHDWLERLWLQQQDWEHHTQAMRHALCSTAPDSLSSSPFLFLPGFCCQAASGDPREAVGIAAAWTLLHRAADILDDWEDGDAVEGMTPALHIATGLIFAAVQSLVVAPGPSGSDQAKLANIEDFARAGSRVCSGQHADLSDASPSLDECWKIAQAKSGECFALACRAGARQAGIPESVSALYGEFGHHLGIVIQICDDLRGIWLPADRRSDLTAGKQTLPVVYALSMTTDKQQERLRHCLQAAPHDTAAAAMARSLIEETGAVVYLAAKTRYHWAQARTSLCAAQPLANTRDELIAWLGEALSLERSL